MPHTHHSPAARKARREGGFTLMELLVTMTVMAVGFAIVVPNLGAFIPEAKLDGSAKKMLRTLDWLRSEARIQARPMSLELDLQHAMWRVVYPPEQQLTLDQDAWTLEESSDDWQELEKGVMFAGAGDANKGMATSGLYRITFDEYGFSADQVVVLKMPQDETLVWSLVLSGLSGRMSIERSEKGEQVRPELVNEGAF